jgi:hypothetical protein
MVIELGLRPHFYAAFLTRLSRHPELTPPLLVEEMVEYYLFDHEDV